MKIRAIVVSALSLLSATVHAAPQATDDCSATFQASGDTVVNFDFAGSQVSSGVIGAPCVTQPVDAVRDLWVCYRSECNGIVEISTCGLTALNTIIAVYEPSACGCPDSQLAIRCCNDDGCGKQSLVRCEMSCGRNYMIRIMIRTNEPLGSGQVSFTCTGEPCPKDTGLTAPECRECCGARPPLVDGLPQPFAPGQVSAVTFGRQDAPAGNISVLRLVDTGDQSLAPTLGSGQLWATQNFTDPSWDLATLGNLFGVTFDGQGNIYVAHTELYQDDVLGSLGVSPAGDGRGAIYRIDGTTGVPTLWRTLPQASGPGAAVGLGNLDFDCQRDCLFAANLEDGRIYSINATTGGISAFDVQSGAIEVESSTGNGNAIAEGPNPNGTSSETPGFAGFGSAPFAVKMAGDRLYYSVWQAAGTPQSIRSIEVDAIGAFIAGTDRLEFTLPVVSPDGSGQGRPVVDISFDSECCMLLAERTTTNFDSSGAHQSRSWRACFDVASGSWAPTNYDLGSVGFTNWQNSTGGIDFVDGALGPQAWVSGDFFSTPVIGGAHYGIAGIPLIDANPGQNDLPGGPMVDLSVSKSMVGSLDITCWATEEPCSIETDDLSCVPNADGTFSYLWDFTIVNGSGQQADMLILSDPAFAPNNVFFLPQPLPPNGVMSLQLPIQGAPGTELCFTATLVRLGSPDPCCTVEVCITLPDCECFEVQKLDLVDLPGAGTFGLNLDIMNLESWNAEWVTLAIDPASIPAGFAADVNPDLIDVAPAVGLGGTIDVDAEAAGGAISVTTNAPAGTQLSLVVGLHTLGFHPCCFKKIQLTVPTDGGAGGTPSDLNGDGVVNAQDLAVLLAAWGSNAPGADVNDDGIVDGKDLAILLGSWNG